MGKPLLLPCPFCGQSDLLVERLDNSASVVICQGLVDEHSACLAHGPVGVQDDDGEDQPGYAAAVREWNCRARQAAGMVLPEPKDASDPNIVESAMNIGWNACLEEFFRRAAVSLPGIGDVAIPPPFAEKIIAKLNRTSVCFDDGQGTDVGLRWLDLLTQLGLLNRIQRSPALWEITEQGEYVIAAHCARAQCEAERGE